MPTTVALDFPLTVIILFYVAVFLLAAILLILLRVSGQISRLAARLSSSSRSAKLAEPDGQPNLAEAEPGSQFAKFLSEDSERKNLSKKEQFKAYRKWRSERGLNWAKSDEED